MSLLVWLISPLLYLIAAIFQWLGGKLEYSLVLRNLMDLFQRLQSALSEFIGFFQRWFDYLGTLIRWDFPSINIPGAGSVGNHLIPARVDIAYIETACLE